MKRVMMVALLAGATAWVTSCASRNGEQAGTGQSYAGGVGNMPLVAGTNWPMRFEDNGTDFTVFQPQADSWDGHQLVGRCAVAVQGPREFTANYGVFGFTAITLVDKSSGTVRLANFRLTSADFPSERNRTQNYVTALAQHFPAEAPALALDSLQTAMSAPVPPKRDHLDNIPPKVIIATQPAVLVYIDGTPALRPVPNTDLQRVINTRLLLLKDATGHFYLHLFDGYLEAASLKGPWTVASQPPAGAEAAEKEATASGEVDLMPGTPDPVTQKEPSLATSPAPQIYAATTPTELIQFRGQAQYAPIPGTDLLYAVNTSGNVFKLTSNQQNYILISGRWFRSSSLNGPWKFVPGNKLPHDFARIPDDSPKENVKASVPGTLQAQEALIANSIPESTAVARTNEMAQPQVDGAMQLEPIEGTSLNYVANSSTPIIEVDPNTWYACDNGIWYSAGAANGPWTVAACVPPVIYTIPPSSPLHYLTYVQVYGTNPETVYEGYTPGYMGTEVADDGTVVYGTGYDYAPWIGGVWYGPPATYGWGFDECWTPWWGWGFGCGFGWGFGLGWGWGGCFPPRPWWGGWGHWHDHDGDAWWHGANHAWANADANVYGHNHGFAGAGAFGRHGYPNGFGQAYNSRTGRIEAGEQARVRNVAGQNFAYNNNLTGRGYAGWNNNYIAPRLGDLNRGYQTYPRGSWYNGRNWPEIPWTPYQRSAAPPLGGPAPHGIFEGPGQGGGVPGGPNTGAQRGGGFHGGEGGFHGGGGGFHGGGGGGGGHR